jgi:hypothetical protein
MAIAVVTTKNALATAYGGAGTYFGLATGSPGSSSTPANEASGSGYARVATVWGTAASSAITGSACTITAGAATYTYAILCSASSGATQIDNAAITSTVLSATGQIVLSPVYTQS